MTLCTCQHEERHHDNEASRCEKIGCGCETFFPDYPMLEARYNDLLADSAGEIAALTAERDALREVLKPFADNAEVWEENESHFTVAYCRRWVKDKPDLKITVGDLLAARRVLGESPKGR